MRNGSTGESTVLHSAPASPGRLREIDIPDARRAAAIRTLPLFASALVAVCWGFKARAMHMAKVARYPELGADLPWSDLRFGIATVGLILLLVGCAALVQIGLRRPLGPDRSWQDIHREGLLWQPRPSREPREGQTPAFDT